MAGQPLFVSSGDLIADRRYKWALDHAARGDLPGAADILAQTVELAPRFATAWFALGAIRDALGERAAAVAAFEAARDADPEDYHGARLQLARLGAGDATPAMTQVYVRRLFDQHAGDFDAALTERLNYRGPQLLVHAVARACRAAGRQPRFSAMLDLGCGTGLAGAAFRAHVGKLTGVDLSSGMIEAARQKGIYDHVEIAELTAFAAAAAGQGHTFDLIAAADVFVYVADLAPAFAAIARVLAGDGLFAFTTETHAGQGVRLRETLRYAHAAESVDAALAEAALVPLLFEQASPRTEKGQPVDGLVFVAAKDAAMASPGAGSDGP